MHTTTLPNGLRVIFQPTTSEVVHCGYVIQAGTRHEDPADFGMAHFIEHTSFKGTERRRGFHINNTLERLGGDLNAFTNKQETVYYATVMKEHFRHAADILTDLVFHSVYAQHEIDKEVEVICDEIESYHDSPAELIFDDFEAMVFAGDPLGRDILGRAERLREYTTADALRFVRKWYRPQHAVFFVTGNLEWPRIVALLQRLAPAAPADGAIVPLPPLPAPIVASPCRKVIEKGTHQAHVVIGATTFGGTDKRRYAMALLNNILGGPAMNSRLNRSLREHAGLVYSVDAYLTTYVDAGFWCVYFGCDAHDVARCRRLLLRELRRFIDNPLTESQLRAAKKQLLGQIGISTDAPEAYSLALGKTFAHYNRYRDIAALCDSIAQVTARSVQEVAAEVYAEERLTTLVYR